MAYTNSPLVSYVKLSPNHSGLRNHAIDTITIHCVAGQASVEALGEVFAPESRQASSNYGVGYDGRIGMYVEEKNRSWCSSSKSNDHRAVTIEVASGTKHPFAVYDAAFEALIELVADICNRNNIKKLLWRGDRSLIGQVDKQNMTVHKWFDNTACPGQHLYDRHSEIARKVNEKLGVVDDIDEIEVGDKVVITAGAVYTNGVPVPPQYIGQTMTVQQKLNGNSLLEELNSWVNDAYLTKKDSSKPVEPEPTPEPAPFNVGDRVKILSGAVYSNGTPVPSKYIGIPLTIQQVGLSMQLIQELYSWVPNKYLVAVNSVSSPTVSAPAKKSVDELAKEVINGNWGVGAARKNALTQAGYDYSAIQARVDEMLSGKKTTTSTKTIDQLAKEVINGDWGSGEERKKRLTAAGYSYSRVQARVNEMLRKK